MPHQGFGTLLRVSRSDSSLGHGLSGVHAGVHASAGARDFAQVEGKRAVEAHAVFDNSSAEGILIIHDFQRATNLTRRQGIEHLPHNGLRAVTGKAFGQRGVDGGSGRRGSQFGQFLVKQAKVAAVLFGDNSSGIG
jgi:hypothetical protein